MGDIHPDTRPRTAERMLFIALVALLALCIPLLFAGPASAGPLTGGFSPTIVGQGADVDGNGSVGPKEYWRYVNRTFIGPMSHGSDALTLRQVKAFYAAL